MYLPIVKSAVLVQLDIVSGQQIRQGKGRSGEGGGEQNELHFEMIVRIWVLGGGAKFMIDLLGSDTDALT